MHERRLSTRFNVSFPVEVEFEGENYTVSTKDLSLGGVFLYAKKTIPINEVVTMTLFLPDEHQDVPLKGEIVHSLPGIGVGVRFLPLPSKQAEQIEAFLKELTE